MTELVGKTNTEKMFALIMTRQKALEDWIGMNKAGSENLMGVTGKFRNTVQLIMKLEEAEKNGTMVELEEGVYELPFQIKITKNNYANVKGIKGAGPDKTILKYGWAQEIDWDPNTNKTDARWFGGILLNGVKDKVLKDFKIEYTGEFYRAGESYFGTINNIHINNSSNCLVENVESTGANRVGIYLTSNEIAFDDNDKVYRGELSVDNLTHHSMNNRVINCYSHHNRVAGIMAANQVNCLIEGNTLEYNGHEKDGGTGYGFAAGAGSVNVNMIVRNNRARYNYRKGIDSHDAYDFTVENNHIEGNRFFGVAIESRGYAMRLVKVNGNTIIQDPSFRLAADDEQPTFEKNPNSDYYRHTAIRIENKSQPRQAWKKQPDTVNIEVKNNKINGIEWDGRGVHRVIELRNNENAEHVRLNVAIEGNTANGKNVHNLFFGAGAGFNGMGNFTFKNNTFNFEKIVDTPFYIQETDTAGIIDGTFEISGNTLNLGTTADRADNDIIYMRTDTRPQVKFNGNTIKIAAAQRAQITFAASRTNEKTKYEVMNNTWQGLTAANLNGNKFITLSNVPAASVNVYNNKAGAEDITLSGATTNSESAATPAVPETRPAPQTWEEKYAAAKPTAKVAAPEPTFKLNWDGATTDTVSSADGRFVITKAESDTGTTPEGYPGLIDKDAGILRARLKSDGASAGAYPKATMPLTTKISTVVLPIKVLNLSGRKKSGAIASGAGKAGDGGKVEIVSGAFAFIEGSTPDKFRITRPSAVMVDGKEYRNEELTVGKWYVLSKNVNPGADFLTFGAAANGNGMVSADIGKDLLFFDRSLSQDELQSASIEVVKKVKPEVLQ